MLLLKVVCFGAEYKMMHVLTALDSGRLADSGRFRGRWYDGPERSITGPATTLQVGEDDEVMEPTGVSLVNGPEVGPRLTPRFGTAPRMRSNIPVANAPAGGASHSQMEGFQAEDRHSPLPHIGLSATAPN